MQQTREAARVAELCEELGRLDPAALARAFPGMAPMAPVGGPSLDQQLERARQAADSFLVCRAQLAARFDRARHRREVPDRPGVALRRQYDLFPDASPMPHSHDHWFGQLGDAGVAELTRCGPALGLVGDF
jgi:hypothetical protein